MGRSRQSIKSPLPFHGFQYFRWISSKSIMWGFPAICQKHCISITSCRDLFGQCHRFKRRKRVFWHHTNVLYRGNLTKFHLQERILIFSSENSRKSRKSLILIIFHKIWSKSDKNPWFSRISDKKTQISFFYMKFGKISSVQNFCMVPKNAFPAFKTVAQTGKVAANAQRQLQGIF